MAIYYDNSWIKLPRSFTKWKWYKNANIFQTYMFLLLNANIEDEELSSFILRRGEICASLSYIANSTGLSIRNVRTSLTKLQSTNDIEIKKLSHGRVIIVLDFNKFQPITADDAEINWVRLYRKICDCPWYHDQNMVHLYIHFMLKVNLELQPNGLYLAQCKCTLRKLSVETGIPVTVLRNSIKKLQKEGEIIFDANSTHLFSVVTICNKESYTNADTNADTTLTQCRHNADTTLTQHLTQEVTQKATQLADDTTYRELESYTTADTNADTNADTTLTQCRHNADTTLTQCRHNADNNNKTIRLKDLKKERKKENIIINNNDNNAHVRVREREDFSEVQDESGLLENEEITCGDEALYKQLLGDKVWTRAICLRFHKSEKDLLTSIEDFKLDMICRGREPHKNLKDLKSHFCDWLRLSGGSSSMPVVETGSQPTEKSAGELWEEAQSAHGDSQSEKDSKLRQDLLGMIEYLKTHPNSSCKPVVETSYNDGTMARLGIVWEP